MFDVTWQMALFYFAAEFLAGAAIGMLVADIIYRTRMTLGLASLSGLLGAVGYLFGAWVVVWADSHSYIDNGVRLDLTPDGENLWLRNRLVEHPLLVYVIPAVLLPLLGLSMRLLCRNRRARA
jgi:hypothetical protein